MRQDFESTKVCLPTLRVGARAKKSTECVSQDYVNREHAWQGYVSRGCMSRYNVSMDYVGKECLSQDYVCKEYMSQVI